MIRRRMTVLMPFHTPFYAPLPAGVALGHFADEGLEVDAVPAAVFGKGTIQALLDGDIEISLGGLMRSFDLAERTGRIIVHFAEVCSRNGFFLLSREPRPAFRWPDLVGKTVISFAEAPTPWQCMLTVLRRHGVDPAQVRIERALPAPDAVAAFRAGRGDMLEQTQPIVEQLIAEGVAHLVVSMGQATGPVPFTSYMTTPEFLAREPDLVRRFSRAVYRTQRWLATHGPGAIARVIAPAFGGIDSAILERVVARYLEQETWAREPLLGRPGFDYLEQILLDGGFITSRHRYEDLVDTRSARQAMDAPGAG
jgi:NitT/TauT family transport system substrate-binding protein